MLGTMMGVIAASKISGVRIDPQFSNVALLLHMNGANGSTVFTDKSPLPKQMTVGGDAKISNVKSKFGGASAVFDGNGDYLFSANIEAFGLGTGDFTVEGYFNFSSLTGDPYLFHFWQDTNNRYALQLNTLNKTLSTFSAANGVAQPVAFSGDTNITIDTWYHIALVRSAGVTAVYLNGIAVIAPQVINTMSWNKSEFHLTSAQPVAGSNYFNGYVDEVRITKGVARYTANFTPPAEPFPNQ